MILTCPDCATRYFVGEDSVPPGGRTVRCTACGNSWRAQGDGPLDLVLPVAPAPAAEIEAEATPAALSDLPAPELPKAFRARVEAQRQVRQAAAAGAVWAGIGAGFCALFASAFLFRVDIVRLVPATAGAYAFARMPVNPTGLEFEQVKGEPAPGGVEFVKVTGAIRNVRDQAASAPPLKVVLLDNHGRRIGGQTVTLPAMVLAPGQSRTFQTVLPDPGFQTAQVDVHFDLDARSSRPQARAAPPHPSAAPHDTALRPAIEAPSGPAVEAHALSASDPLALDNAHPAAVSPAGHG